MSSSSNAGEDFGKWRPNILIFLSLIAWGIGFGWLGVHDPSKWRIAAGMYIVGRDFSSTLFLSSRSELIDSSNCISNDIDFLDGCVSHCLPYFCNANL